MPTPSRTVLGARMSRRAALAGLAAGAAGALVGCTPRGVRLDEDPEPVEPEVDPDVVIATEALTAQQSMIALVSATQARHRRLAVRLAPLLATHRAHADLLSDAVPEPPATTPSAASPASPGSRPTTGGPASSGSTGVDATAPAPVRVPRDPARAIGALAQAERELVVATKQHAFKAQSGSFARVLGSMAAAAAQHAAVLATDEEAQ